MNTTKANLMTALFLGLNCALSDGRSIAGVQKVEMESGGRKCWNVFGVLSGQKAPGWHFVRSID